MAKKVYELVFGAADISLRLNEAVDKAFETVSYLVNNVTGNLHTLFCTLARFISGLMFHEIIQFLCVQLLPSSPGRLLEPAD